jgi:hypothetical protein
MSERDWLARFEAEARAAGDQQRLRLVELTWLPDQHRETNPDSMLALLAEGRLLARKLREPWWELYYEARRAGALMKYKGDVAAGLELSVRNALEARKPLYENYPYRFGIYDDLVVAYLYTDPVGYADEVREALQWLARHAPAAGSPRYLVAARRRWLHDELGELDAAEEMARQGLALAAGDEDCTTARWHAVFCFSHLCQLAWQRRDWAALAERTRAGEELAQGADLKLELAEFQLWQALLARRDRDEARARLLWRQACQRVDRLGMPPDHIWFDALCAYHGQGGEWSAELAARDRELALLLGKGRHAAECRCRVERCRLLRRMGRPLADELLAARIATSRLRRPAAVLSQLRRIEAGTE